MKLTYSQKLKTAMMLTKTTQEELARILGTTQANLSQKITADNFKIKDYEKLVTALGCSLEINIVFPDGSKI